MSDRWFARVGTGGGFELMRVHGYTESTDRASSCYCFEVVYGWKYPPTGSAGSVNGIALDEMIASGFMWEIIVDPNVNGSRSLDPSA